MTVIEKPARKIISGTGWSNPLTFDIYIESSSHIQVWADAELLDLGVDYTVADVANPAGFSVTITDTGRTPVAFIIIHTPPLIQGTDLSGGGVFGAAYMAGLDALTRRLQSLEDTVSRAVVLPIDTPLDTPALTIEELAVGHFWKADADGNLVDGGDADDISSAQGYAAQTALDAIATAADRVQTGLDRVQTGLDAAAAAASAASIVADNSALAALNIAANRAIFNLDNQGWWLPTVGDISAEITAEDPRYVASAGDATGATGGWYRAGGVQDGFFWREDGARPPLPIADRVMIGDAVTYTGNKSPNPSGGDWLSEYGANYFIKNSHMAVLTTGHYAFLAAAQAAAGSSTGGGGVFAVALNRGNTAFVRAIYAEAMHMPGDDAGGTGGIEVQVGNYSGADITPNPYNLGGGGAGGVTIGAESGYNYRLGDANTPLAAPTLPAGAALTFSGGSIAAAYQRFRVGMVFSTNALYRGADGLTGNAVAINMAAGHEITWAGANSLTRQAFMRSDITAVSGDEVGILFANRKITLCGASERAIATFNDDHGGSGAVNWLKLTNSRTNVNVSIAADGSDTNSGVQMISKGIGVIQFLSHGGSGEHFRVAPASQAVNYISVAGGTAGINPRFAVAGLDANISLIVRGKGTGGARLEDGGSAAKIEINTTGIGFFGATPVAQQTMAAATGTATRTAFDTASVTLPELAERVKAMIDNDRAYGIYA